MKKVIGIILFISLFWGCSNSDTDAPKTEPLNVEGAEMPRVVSANKLEYPFLANLAGIEGCLTIKIGINAEGKLIGYKIVDRKFQSSSIPFSKFGIKLFHSRFDSLAIKYVKSMTFEPAIKDGNPVDIWVNQPIRWSLEK